MAGNDRINKSAARHDGWTPERRARFLTALTAGCNVTAAAGVAGMGARGAYAMREREPGFAAQWADALQEGYEQLERELLAFALGSGAAGGAADGGEAARPFDPDLAIKVLAMRNARDKRPTGRPPKRVPTKAELVDILDKRMVLLAKSGRRR